MKSKILASEYHPGFDSWVQKQTKYGTFDGWAMIHPQDADIDNSYDGCRIAEFRADLQAYREKAKWLRQRAIGAKILFETNQTLIYDCNIENNFLETLAMLEKQADDAKEYYERMKAYEPMFVKNLLKQRRETREMIDKRKA